MKTEQVQHDMLTSPLDRFDYLVQADEKSVEAQWTNARSTYVNGMLDYLKEVRLGAAKYADRVLF